ncbi:helicase associated domain-containing protein [Colletotrichum costaricense]|uniref:RNA helicase n=1 Tax=Colletotrichum costaricense TaxID=1209916 RepID=A0AAI9YJY7_9PEZI|nr:helicase associated domain-containing protein [Colletotrichum costaricense]KAK1514068.1 helicase associated domain-containing protein [Colletotrichum costaricense]
MADFDLNSAFIPALHKPSALLPIAKHRQALLYLIETKQVTIVVGQTGSGKTTQIPQFLEAAGWCADGKVIGITQPRRVAATTVALRVAEEVGCEIGQQVGYAIRFEDNTSAQTRIKFMTDGLLIREALVDPLLTRYSVIMVDEAHERSISTDILLGLLKKILKKRPELRIIISSATLQAEEFLKFFTTSPGDEQKKTVTAPEDKDGKADAADDNEKGAIISLEGRAHHVDVLYLESPTEDYVEKAISTVFDIHTTESEGDILVFLTGREEIDNAVQAVADRLLDPNQPRGQQTLQALPLYAGLSTEQQMYVFDKPPEGTRKVVFATNMAEASITIDGIVYVIDTGFAKLRAYNPRTGIETLTSTAISKASASQRAGRAGRTRPGKCFRLYTEDAYLALPEVTVPEMQRSNLAPFILQLKALGIDNVLRFNFLSPPPAELMAKALELLYSLGALDDYAKLTKPLGYRMAELAVEPMMAKTLLGAQSFGCLSEMLTIAAMTSAGGNNVWFHHDGERQQMELSRRKFAADEGDHLTLLNAYQAFVTKGRKESKFCRDHNLNFKTMTRAVSIRGQLKRYLEKFGIAADNEQQQQQQSFGPAGSRQQHQQKHDNSTKAEQIRRCLTTGYFAHAARMQPDGTFRNVSGETTLHAHPSSLMFNRKADWVIFHEVMETANKIFIRDITKIEKNWLVEYAPEFYQLSDSSARRARDEAEAETL